MTTNRIYTFPDLTDEVLENKLKVIFISDSEQPAMTIAVQFPLGKFYSPWGAEGLAELSIALMQKGTHRYSHEEFSGRLEQTGSSLFSDVGEEHAILGCKFLSRFSDEIIPLFWEMVTQPGLHENELKMLKRELITSLQAESADPHSLAGKMFNRMLFGVEHPAGRRLSIETIKKITLPQITSFVSQHIVPSDAFAVIAGDCSKDTYHKKWRPLLNQWQSDTTPQRLRFAAPENPTQNTIHLVDKPDLSQATVIIGHLVPPEGYEQRNALALANYILGGGNFSSRLMKEIRSKLGKTYGIASQINASLQIGTFSIATSTQSHQLKEMIDTIFTVYQDYSEHGATAEELQKAQRFAAGNMAFQLEGIGNMAEKLLWLELYGRPRSYLENFAEIISSISLDAVNEEIGRHLSQKHFIISVAGNQKAVLDDLSSFGTVEMTNFRQIK